jgi:serine/threonine protein kinase
VIGTTLAHYRITAALGAGGMGEVWRATDTKLGREVALKVLPEEFVDDSQRLDRFEREARAVASLNHPHIVTIHSVEEAEGVRFLTMELIEGRSLEKLIPEGGLELGLFLDLATPLAEAISAAHDKSVIHRDLKPANVMVDADGRLKVLDFGLAKLQEFGDPSESTELPTEALTGIGTVVGTMPYMSPEQIEGEIVDHRSDIFSLGVLLYEMATGGRPFQGKSSPALMSSILKDLPTPVVELRSDFPRHLGRMGGGGFAAGSRGEPSEKLAKLDGIWRDPARRGILGRGAAVQVLEQRCRPLGAGRRAERGHRDRSVAILLPPGDRPQFDAAVGERRIRRSDHGQRARRALRHGGEPPPSGQEASSCRAARRHGFQRSSLGGKLRSEFRTGRSLRLAGRPRPADRFHLCGPLRRTRSCDQ